MKLVDNTCVKFSELTASNAPVPGGGGVSGLVGALAVALGDMVGELTVGKKKYADVEEEIKALMARSQELRVRLLELVDEDAENFAPLAEAYGIPKDEPGRDEKLEECLHVAAKGPMEIFDVCCEVIELQDAFAQKGSKLMISDAATGAALARGALYGAAINVKVNTRLMKDAAYAANLDKHIEEGLAKYGKLADEVFEGVWQRF